MRKAQHVVSIALEAQEQVVHPAEPLGDPRPGLVEVHHRADDEQLAQALIEVAQPAGRGLHPALQRAGRDRCAGDICKRLGCAVGRCW